MEADDGRLYFSTALEYKFAKECPADVCSDLGDITQIFHLLHFVESKA